MKELDCDKCLVFPVKRIFGSTDNFQKAKEKLKDAEKISDLNSDEEVSVLRKRRQGNAARKLPDSDTSDLDKSPVSKPRKLNYPAPPVKEASIRGIQIATKRIRSEESHDINSQEYRSPNSPGPDSTPKRKRPYIASETKSSKKIIHEHSGGKNMTPSMEFQRCSNVSSATAGNPIVFKQRPPGFVPGNELVRSLTGLGDLGDPPTINDAIGLQDFLLTHFARIKQKLNLIIANQNALADQWKRSHDKVELEADIQTDENIMDIVAVLPIETDVQLIDIEEAIVDENCYKKLVRELSKIGGNSLKSVTLNLVRRIFSNEVAEKYNWEGKKKKKKFSDLTLSNVIMDAARKRYDDATDHDIAQIIKDWLRHASERIKKTNTPAIETTAKESTAKESSAKESTARESTAKESSAKKSPPKRAQP